MGSKENKNKKKRSKEKNNSGKKFSLFRKKSSLSEKSAAKPEKKKKAQKREREEGEKTKKKAAVKKDPKRKEVRKAKTEGAKQPIPVGETAVNSGIDSNEENEPPKKPIKPQSLKTKKKPAKSSKKVVKVAKGSTTDTTEPTTNGPAAKVEKAKPESDKIKKSNKGKVEAKPDTDANAKNVNFCTGDAISTTAEESRKKVCDNLLDGETDVDLTQKEKMEKDKNKDGIATVGQSEKWKGLLNKMIEKGNYGIAKEFKNVSDYLPKSVTRRDFDRNMNKNRFEDVVCIDQTRVRLIGGGYIHASWVEVSDTKKAILTQLPMSETAADFWQMVLENDVQAILLIATTFELITFNGEATFPGKRDFLHFDGPFLHVRVGEFDSRQITKQWTMHTICVNNGDRKKFVHVHHYNGWSHGMSPRAIADIWQIQSVLRKYSGPPVYMSLSGCGRAGTYAAFEVAHDRLHNSDYIRVDLSECIKKVRNGRIHSVQRQEQLRTMYLLMAEHIVNNGYDKSLTEEERSKLCTIIKSLHQPM